MMKGVANGKMYDVITMEDFMYNVPTYRHEAGRIAVLTEGFILPIVRRRDEPGICIEECLFHVTLPHTSVAESYSANTLIDFKVDSMRELLDKTECFREVEREILTSPDNIFTPKRNQDDEPLVRLLKEAIIAKGIDINKYKDRFSQFDNDRRLLNNKRISMDKFINSASAFDMRAMLVIEDTNPDVANPIGRRIEICLTGLEDEEIIAPPDNNLKCEEDAGEETYITEVSDAPGYDEEGEDE